MAKTILCYGDSNTWGYNPKTKKRYQKNERWTGILQSTLGKGYEVIEEGMNSRTTIWDDPVGDYRNGKAYLTPCLKSHSPLDIVTLFLGINDLKHRFSLSAFDVACGIEVLVELVLNSKAGPEGKSPQLLIISPPLLGNLSDEADTFEGAHVKSNQLSTFYSSIATAKNCTFIDASSVVKTSDIDGIHLDLEEHRKLGLAITLCIKGMLF